MVSKMIINSDIEKYKPIKAILLRLLAESEYKGFNLEDIKPYTDIYF